MQLMKPEKVIQRNLQQLRELIDSTDDPAEKRIAYAMEHAIRWVTLKTVGWPPMRDEAIMIAEILRREIKQKTAKITKA